MKISEFASEVDRITVMVLGGSMSAADFVRAFDRLFLDEMPNEIGERLYNALSKLQDWAALYEEDPVHRSEEKALIDEGGLKSGVQLFLDTYGEDLRNARGVAR